MMHAICNSSHIFLEGISVFPCWSRDQIAGWMRGNGKKHGRTQEFEQPPAPPLPQTRSPSHLKVICRSRIYSRTRLVWRSPPSRFERGYVRLLPSMDLSVNGLTLCESVMDLHFKRVQRTWEAKDRVWNITIYFKIIPWYFRMWLMF